jgi:hypothetical protein
MPHSTKLPHGKVSRAGMVLTEALVAIATLAMGVMALGTITQNSIATTILAKDYLVARGLAKEGEEIVKNIRLTNRMKRPTLSNCWLLPDVSGSCSINTNPSDYMKANHHFVAYLKNGAWMLEDKSNDLPDPDLPKASTNIPFQLFSDDNGFYPQPQSIKPAGATGSKFYRSIKPTVVTDDTATFEIKVQWKDGAKTREINRFITMYNYL